MKKNMRAPAVPLVTVDPYFNVWSVSDCLYDDYTRHWTGKPHGMTGIAMIDGVPFKFMGKVGIDDTSELSEPRCMTQKSLRVTPLTTKYIFESEGIRLEVDFTTPLLPDNLDILSRPVSYISFKAYSTDGENHSLKIYFDVTGEWCVNTKDQKVIWFRKKTGKINAMLMGTEEQAVLGRYGDDVRIDWGYFYLLTQEDGNTFTTIDTCSIRYEFIRNGKILTSDNAQIHKTIENDVQVMACVMNLGMVSADCKSRLIALAYDDLYSVEYFGKPLPAYWRRNGMTFDEMITKSIEEYPQIIEMCNSFDTELIACAVSSGGDIYSDILSLAYRQAISAHKLVQDESGEILFFSKENFSNGCMGTVDVSYPSIPVFLIYNTELVKGMMRPVFRYANSGDWPYDFAPHDVGTYPKANGQVYGDNELHGQMPVEECGNILIMTAAVCLAEKSTEFAEENWDLLTKWTRYLEQNGMDPGNQLCTDDFAGHLAHNTNLSIKAILAIAGYSILCGMLGEQGNAVRYLEMAKEMSGKWEAMANDGDHYRLSFNSPDTWSQKYNLIWDSLFGLNIFPVSILKKEIDYYIKKQNKYGTPLDNRKSYTKVDWLVWIAAMAESGEDFKKLIYPLWDFLNESPSRIPFTDWYDTVTGKQEGFQCRSVVGGVFIKLLKDKSILINNIVDGVHKNDIQRKS